MSAICCFYFFFISDHSFGNRYRPLVSADDISLYHLLQKPNIANDYTKWNSFENMLFILISHIFIRSRRILLDNFFNSSNICIYTTFTSHDKNPLEYINSSYHKYKLTFELSSALTTLISISELHVSVTSVMCPLDTVKCCFYNTEFTWHMY